MSVSGYLVGVAYLLVVCGVLGFFAVECRRALLPGWTGAPARLAEVLLAISAFVVLAEMLGLFGLLTRVGLLLAAIALGVGARAVVHRGYVGAGDPAEPPAPARAAWALPLSLIVAALAIAHWSGGVIDSLDAGIYRQDSTWYHLPVAAGFVQGGDTWSLQFTDPMALTAWFYPMNSELLHAGGMLAFGNDFLSPFLNLLWMALALLAAWCIGRPFGLGALTLLAAALVLDSEMMQVQAGNAPSDIAGVFLLLAVAAILLNAGAADRMGRETVRDGPLVLAALAGGLAIGTKITLLAPVAVILAGTVLLAGRARRARVSFIWICGLLATGGYWYARNLWHAGNPLPWISLGPFSSPDQLPLYPRPPHSVADYATDFHAWVHQLSPGLAHTLGHLWALILAGAAAGLVLALLRGQPLRRVLAAAGLAAALAYVFIPVSASGSPGHPSGFESNLRYLAPTLALGLVLLVLELGKHRSRLPALAAGVGLVFAVDALTSPSWQGSGLLGGIALALALIAVPTALALMWRAGTSTAGLAAVAAAAFALFVTLGFPAQRDYLRSRYLPSLAPAADNPGFRATPQWRRLQGWARQTRDATIGLVGPPAAFGQYVFYGADLSNRVDYVGEEGPHGSYRPIEDCPTWRRAVDGGGYRYVVITPASAIGPGSLPQESLWMSNAPSARQILRAGPAAVYRINGRLNPRGCATEHLPPVVRVPGGGFAVPSTGLGLPPPPRSR